MATASVRTQLTPFASDILDGLTARPKKLSPRYFYDDLGSALFEAITLLPEYGLTRADERLLHNHADDIAAFASRVRTVAELGSGSGKKTRRILEAMCRRHAVLRYRPIDVSVAALSACQRELQSVCQVDPVRDDWLQGIAAVTAQRRPNESFLLLFLGSSIGNLDRAAIPEFLHNVRLHLQPGDLFLLGADLVKDVDRMIAAYDDPTGVTAAFNLNLLARINRECDANFDLRTFAHEVRWNGPERRIEMHLLSCRNQEIHLAALDTTLHFRSGETIWTESSHKFTRSELDGYARSSGFQALIAWVDQEWPFAETIWRVE